ncbi:MAG: phosphogluconate dehydrogenase (NAD(+)-dependent, decarboxylating) [Candidatus Dormibacteria bacterium]
MQLGMIGLGRMGGNMARRLVERGHRVVAWTRSAERLQHTVADGAVGAASVSDLVRRLDAPRVVWLMIPAGSPVDDMLAELVPLLSPGDVIVDGGNSMWKDSQRRAAELAEHGIGFIDAGVSGGVWGLTVGYCIMAGGSPQHFAMVEPAVRDLAPEDGYRLVGPSGAGHYVKMVHNGIEYGMLQAYGEGFEILHSSPFQLDLGNIAQLWNQGSVVRSWLLELAQRAFGDEGNDLAGIKGYVDDSGEGRWTVQAAIDQDVPAPVITYSLLARFASRQSDSYAAQLVAALRNQFGGHAVKTEPVPAGKNSH